jgi:hypothetical protein
MEEEKRNACIEIMNVLLSHRISQMFSEPVDPIADECPDYFDVIKFPMDLSTIQRKLADNVYTSVGQWKNDVDLVWSNAILYNGSDSYVAIICRDLEKIFENSFQSVFDDALSDWYGQLRSLVDEFGSELKLMSVTMPLRRRRSSSVLEFPNAPLTPVEPPWSWEETARLGEAIRGITEKARVRRLMGILRQMDPQLVAGRKTLDVDLLQLGPATLAALKAEIELRPVTSTIC